MSSLTFCFSRCVRKSGGETGEAFHTLPENDEDKRYKSRLALL